MNRRQMFGGIGGILGWLGFKSAAKAESTDPVLRGIIVFKIQVGSLPPFKVETFIERLKDKWKKSLTKPDGSSPLKGWETVWQPFRPSNDVYESSSVQVFLIDKSGNKDEILPELVDFHVDLMEEFGNKYEEFKEKVKDYVLLMLGAPVVKIELDPQQLDMCFQETYDDLDQHAHGIGGINALPIRGIGLLKRGALARAKQMLGRVRSGVAGIVAGHVDGGWLITEGNLDLQSFYDDLKEL